MVKLLDVGESVTKKDIQKLEEKWGVKLSGEYKKFILQNNGGTPEEMIGFEFMEKDPVTNKLFEQGLDVQYFSDIHELDSGYDNLVSEGVIPQKFISFASDSCGNEILLCADGSHNNGKVYFANHEMYEPETGLWVMTEVAESFSEFLAKLKPVDF